jgi:transposase
MGGAIKSDQLKGSSLEPRDLQEASGVSFHPAAAQCLASDFTLSGPFVEFAERGLNVGYSSVWTFVHAEGLSYKKHHRPRTVASRPSRGGGRDGYGPA